VLSDAETDSDAPLESDDSDLYEGGEDGAAEQKQDNEDDSMLRWQQIKRFFKCSDPNTEEEEMQKGNRLVKVQAFFDAFIQACKHFIWLHNALPLMILSKLSRADVYSNNT